MTRAAAVALVAMFATAAASLVVAGLYALAIVPGVLACVWLPDAVGAREVK